MQVLESIWRFTLKRPDQLELSNVYPIVEQIERLVVVLSGSGFTVFLILWGGFSKNVSLVYSGLFPGILISVTIFFTYFRVKEKYQPAFYSIFYVIILLLFASVGYVTQESFLYLFINHNALIPMVLSQALRPGRFTSVPVLIFFAIFLIASNFFTDHSESLNLLELFLFLWSSIAALSLQIIGFFMVNRFAELRSLIESEKKELLLARTVHESLFPAFQGNDKIQFYTFRSPENELGGDFYDLVFLREGNVGLFVSDISGHGISAAMLSAAMKVILNKLPYRCRIDPEEMLTRFDQIITENYDSHHATAVYILFDFIKKEVTMANAGHPPILYAPRGKPFQELNTHGSLLGYGFRTPAADSMILPVQNGDRFLFYTDGLVEYETIDGTVDTFEIQEVLHGTEHMSGDECIDQIISRVRKRNNFERFRDDVLIVMAEIQ